MSKEVNKEQTKAAKQEKITELSEEQLVEAAGGGPPNARGASQAGECGDSWGHNHRPK